MAGGVGDGVGAGVGVAASIDGVAASGAAGVGVGDPGDGVGDGVDGGVNTGVGVGANIVGVVTSGAAGVGVGDGAGRAVGVGKPAPVNWITSSGRFAPASSELKSYPSELEVSIAKDLKEPTAGAIAAVTSTSLQTPVAEPCVKLANVPPSAGRLA